MAGMQSRLSKSLGGREDERKLRREYERIMALPPEQLMPEFVRVQLAPGIEPPPRPEGPPPPWMAQRPAGVSRSRERSRPSRSTSNDYARSIARFSTPSEVGATLLPCSSRRSVSAESSLTSRSRSSRNGITSIPRTESNPSGTRARCAGFGIGRGEWRRSPAKERLS